MAFYDDDGYHNDNPDDIAESKEIKELKEIDREKTTIEDFDDDYWKSDRTHDMYIKKFHGITVNKYTKETFGGCICNDSSQKSNDLSKKEDSLKICEKCCPEYEAEVCDCNYKGCEKRVMKWNCNCDSTCACPYFCKKHKETREARLLLAKIASKEINEINKKLQKRYWFMRHSYRRNTVYRNRITTINGYDVYHTSDTINSYKSLLVFDSKIGTFI